MWKNNTKTNSPNLNAQGDMVILPDMLFQKYAGRQKCLDDEIYSETSFSK